MIANRSLEKAEEMAAEIKAEGGMAPAIQADVSKTFDADKVTAAALVAFGNLDILVNISSVGAIRPHGFCAYYDASKGGNHCAHASPCT